jgi:hypothetical protein
MPNYKEHRQELLTNLTMYNPALQSIIRFMEFYFQHGILLRKIERSVYLF